MFRMRIRESYLKKGIVLSSSRPLLESVADSSPKEMILFDGRYSIVVKEDMVPIFASLVLLTLCLSFLCRS